MKIFRETDSAFRTADAASFVGAARTKLLASSDEAVQVNVYHVRFDDGARTNRHMHSGPRWLFVTEGRIRAQSAGGAAVDIDAGSAALFSPGEKPWHGAVPGSHGVHIAVNVDAQTTWLELVTDSDYRAETA